MGFEIKWICVLLTQKLIHFELQDHVWDKRWNMYHGKIKMIYLKCAYIEQVTENLNSVKQVKT